MSYARRCSTRSARGPSQWVARTGRATASWGRGLWFDLKLSLKLAVEAVGRALLKQRTVIILEIPADGDRVRPKHLAAAARVKTRPDRAGDFPLTPLP